MSSSRTSGERKPPKAKKNGFFNKIKQIFGNSDSSSLPPPNNSLTAQRSRRSSQNSAATSGGVSFGVSATRTRSKSSFIFGGSRAEKQQHETQKDAKAALEERRAKCMAIKLAKRDPPAVQRLLVDCEFCNPPPHFGRRYDVPSPRYTSADARQQLTAMAQRPEPLTAENEADWNPGLNEWLAIRQKWLTTTTDAQPIHHLEHDLTPDRYYTVYEKLIYQTRPFKHPLNLGDLVQILKAGWIGEGSWPENPETQVWSTDSDQEEFPPQAATGAAGVAGAGSGTTGAGSGTTGATATGAPGATATGAPADMRDATPSTLDGPSSSSTSVAGPQGAKMPAIHVQFSDSPHPRDSPQGASKVEMAPLSRVQSSLGGISLRPVVSSQSSIVSLTDSD